jgi:hypothetical protein
LWEEHQGCGLFPEQEAVSLDGRVQTEARECVGTGMRRGKFQAIIKASFPDGSGEMQRKQQRTCSENVAGGKSISALFSRIKNQ